MYMCTQEGQLLRNISWLCKSWVPTVKISNNDNNNHNHFIQVWMDLAEYSGFTNWDYKSKWITGNQIKRWFLVRGENQRTRGKTSQTCVHPCWDVSWNTSYMHCRTNYPFPGEARGNHNKLCEQSKCVYYEMKKIKQNKVKYETTWTSHD